MSKVTIEKGKILIYRVFDIGEEINLVKLESLLKEKTERFRFARGNRKAIVISDAPLSFTMTEEKIEIVDQIYCFEVIAKVWTYGTFSLTLQYNIPAGTDWQKLVELAHLFENSTLIDYFAKSKAKDFTSTASVVMKKTNEWDTYEDYVIYFFEKINGIDSPMDLKDHANIPALILAEPKEELSESMKQNVHAMTYQYLKNDLAIIDWNSALLIEPSGSMDLPDVIEFALTQLLEMRYYDDLLDQKLATLYSSIENKSVGFLNDPFTKISREAGQTYIELSEIIETIENSFKVVGDFYLATIFRAASRRFRFNDWLSNINSKLGNLAEVSKVLQGEIHARRALASEMIIIALIAFEVVPVLYKLFAK